MNAPNIRKDNVVLTKRQKEWIIELLWNSLKRETGCPDRRQTGWGSKTQTGLIACVHRIINCQAGKEDS